MIKKITEKIKEKNASGSLYFGVIIMIVAFVAVLVSVNFYQLYSLNVRAQLVCDIIADGAAVAGQTAGGFDIILAKNMADQLFQANSLDNTRHSYEINIVRETGGQYDGYMRIEVFYKLLSNSHGSHFLNLYSNENIESNYTATAKATSLAKVISHNSTIMTESFMQNPNLSLPITSTTKENRDYLQTSIFINNFLSPANNPIYYAESDFGVRCLIYDYLTFHSVPCEEWKNSSSLEAIYEFYRTYDGDSWEKLQYTDSSLIQSTANTGQPTIILCKKTNNTVQCYIVVPQAEADSNHITVAYSNTDKGANGETINWNEFCDNYTNIIVLTTD